MSELSPRNLIEAIDLISSEFSQLKASNLSDQYKLFLEVLGMQLIQYRRHRRV